MSDTFKAIAAFIGVVVLFLGLDWVIMGNDFFMFKVFAPKTEQVRREVVEESLAYRRGTILTLGQYRAQYESADDAHKPAIADLILQTAENFDLNKSDVSPQLRSFIEQLRSNPSGNSTR